MPKNGDAEEGRAGSRQVREEKRGDFAVVTPSSPSSHTNVSPIKVDFMKISLQNEKHHCRLGRVSAAII